MVQIKNYMEDCVYEQLDKVIKTTGGCNCDMCRNDVAAIALNMLPPKYIVTEMGQLYSKLSILQQQFDIDVIAAITRACEVVKKKPHH